MEKNSRRNEHELNKNILGNAKPYQSKCPKNERLLLKNGAGH